LILVDANLLIYAYDRSSPVHEQARDWLLAAFTGVEPVCLTWQTVLAFLRITTHARIFQRPLLIGEAVDRVESWFEQPATRLLQPGDRHWSILSRLLPDAQARGPLVMDAHLAAVAVEHGATLYTSDRDFSRFPSVRVIDPLLAA
jgi:toxin-antitoxin system PIN domain toxin